MSARLLLCTVALGFGIVSACGGAADTGLFSGTGGGGTDSGSGSDGNARDAAGGMDSSSADSGTTLDGMPPPRDASPPPPDTAPPVDVVKCEGTGGCKVGMDACCRHSMGGGNFSYSCVPIGTCTQGNDLEIPCDKQRDCDLLGAAGDVCCVTAATGGASDVSCAPATDCTMANGRAIVCDPNNSSSCSTTANLRCLVSTLTIPGYDICR